MSNKESPSRWNCVQSAHHDEGFLEGHQAADAQQSRDDVSESVQEWEGVGRGRSQMVWVSQIMVVRGG